MPADVGSFPTTRYQGSKLKLLAFVWQGIEHLSFHSALDLFSGTAAVSYLFKVQGKRVTCNDLLRCNREVATALVVNQRRQLTADVLEQLMRPDPGRSYDDFIARTFAGVFYLDEENRWLDLLAQNIAAVACPELRSLAYQALFQACLAKRPYSLFHRANLYMRLAPVRRSFGNKRSWDRPFEAHFRRAVEAANAAVFASANDHEARCGDALNAPPGHDLVYLDPPYVDARRAGVDYLDYYHFLEGLCRYREWPELVERRYKHRPLRRVDNPWTDPRRVHQCFDAVLEQHRQSTLVISYRDDGVPTIEELVRLLRRHGKRDARRHHRDHQYVLSTRRGREVLLVAE